MLGAGRSKGIDASKKYASASMTVDRPAWAQANTRSEVTRLGVDGPVLAQASIRLCVDRPAWAQANTRLGVDGPAWELANTRLDVDGTIATRPPATDGRSMDRGIAVLHCPPVNGSVRHTPMADRWSIPVLHGATDDGTTSSWALCPPPAAQVLHRGTAKRGREQARERASSERAREKEREK
jgi:hypothetical protein